MLNCKRGDFVRSKDTRQIGYIERIDVDSIEIYMASHDFICSVDVLTDCFEFPNGSQIVFTKNISDTSITTTRKLTPEEEVDKAMSDAFWGAPSHLPVSSSTREQRKKDGRCEECGDPLPMTVYGLSECPKHPKNKEPVKW